MGEYIHYWQNTITLNGLKKQLSGENSTKNNCLGGEEMNGNIEFLISVVEERVKYRNFILECQNPSFLDRQEIEKEIEQLICAIELIKQKFS